MTISRRDALNVAADVLARSDWLLVDRLAEGGDEHASENADRIVEILREEVARMGQDACNCPAGANGRAPHWRICALYGQASNPVPATAPPPSGAAGATTPSVSDGGPTYATGGYVGPVAPNAGRPGVIHGARTSGPLDPEIHAALVRSVERAHGGVAAASAALGIGTDPAGAAERIAAEDARNGRSWT